MKKRRWLRWLLLGALSLALAFVGFIWWLLPGIHRIDHDVDLPVRYAADLIYVEPETSDGVKLSLLADTGGGLFLTSSCAERCGLRGVVLPGERRARLPVFRPDAWIPEVTGGEKWMPIVDGDRDGMLGQRWFAGGVWTFDYPKKKLVLHRIPFTPAPEMTRHATVGFRHLWGMRTANHPRITVTVDGAKLEALFDTGATVWPSAEAGRLLGDRRPSERATSFVGADVFQRWRNAHPKWTVVERGCQKSGEALIEVPEVEVAGMKVGPVWFTRRGNEQLDWMSSFMDRHIQASVGGSLLRFFRVTVDYPNAVAWFEKSGQAPLKE